MAHLPTLSFESQRYLETDGTVAIDIELDAAVAFPVTLEFRTQPETATQGQDFYGVFEKITFAPGETLKSVAVTILEDELVEEDETFLAVISYVNGANIDEDAVRIYIDDAPRGEVPNLFFYGPLYGTNYEWSGELEFLVRLSHATTRAVEVTLETVPIAGGATPGADFVATRETVRFEAGERFGSFTVGVVRDAQDETDESLVVKASDAVNAVLQTPQLTATITENLRPMVWLPQPTVTVTEGVVARVPVKLNRLMSEPVSVFMASQEISAKRGPGNDYYGIFTEAVFAPGETEVTVPVQTLADGMPESTETLRVRLLNPTDGLQIRFRQDVGVVRIRD